MHADHSGWTETESLDTFDSTLAHMRELVFGCFDAAGIRSVAEIGAENGFFTAKLLDWAAESGAERVVAIDPAPQPLLRELADVRPELELVIDTSHEALPALEPADAMIIDGDHNYFTVSGELDRIAQRAGSGPMPLLVLHDVGWPLGRRDSYHDFTAIPEEDRRPLAHEVFLVPGEHGVVERGLYYACTAATEGGERNGVLTALEDFLAGRPDLRSAIVAPFFGLAVVWQRDAPWAPALERTIAPWDRNPLLERVEAKRIEHLVAEFQNLQRVDALYTADYVHRYRLIGRLLPILDSNAFALAERLSALRQRGKPAISRADLADLLTDLAGDDIDVDHLRHHPEPSPEGPVPMRTVEPAAPQRRAVSPADLAGDSL